MAEATLGLSAGFAFVAATIYGYVGVRFLRRKVSGEARLAAWMFSLWWVGLATTSAVGGFTSLAGLFGTPSLAVIAPITYTLLAVISLALIGLLYYLTYLFTGRKEALLPIVSLYTSVGVVLAYAVAQSNPTGVVVSRWSVGLTFERPLSGPIALVILTALILPQIIAAVAYFTLYFKLHDRVQRFRVLVVSWSLILWFGIGFVTSASGLSQSDAAQVSSRVLGLAAALAILMAYFTPPWLRNRLGFPAPVN